MGQADDAPMRSILADGSRAVLPKLCDRSRWRRPAGPGKGFRHAMPGFIRTQPEAVQSCNVPFSDRDQSSRRSSAALVALGIVVVFMNDAAAGVSADSCPLYAEDFAAFAGPGGFDDGEFRVLWCLSGATVSGGSFCPTGSALRLNSSTSDPILWLDLGDSSCAQITLEFDYSQFAPAGTVLRFRAGPDGALNCAAIFPGTAGGLDVIGGVCTNFSHTIDVNGARSIAWKFDHGQPGANAILIDNLRITRSGCCGPRQPRHDCCEPGAAGCADKAISACVCAIDPYCCRIEWDELCVEEVSRFGCGECTTADPCLDGFAIGFGARYYSGPICQHFPELFEFCQGNGPYLGSGTICAAPGDQTMWFGTGFPQSAAITKCLDFSGTDEIVLQFSYAKSPNTLGPRIEANIDDGPFQTLWSAPFRGPGTGQCTDVALDLSPLAGLSNLRLRFISGSSLSNGAAFDDIVLTADPLGSHACCQVGSPGCADPPIETCVCGFDPYCCEVAWDAICVAEVGVLGCGESCFAPVGADLNRDGLINGLDLGILLASWGAPPPNPADLNADGIVDGIDLGILLGNWTV